MGLQAAIQLAQQRHSPNRKFKSPGDWMSPLVSSMHWNPKEVGSKGSEEWIGKSKDKQAKSFLRSVYSSLFSFLPCPLYRLLRGGVV